MSQEKIKQLLAPACRYPWIAGLTNYPIEEHVRDCLICQEYQIKNAEPPGNHLLGSFKVED